MPKQQLVMDSIISTNGKNFGDDFAEHSTALLAYWDTNLICRYANSAYVEWFGKHPNLMINKIHLKQLLGPLLYGKNLPYINSVLTGTKQVFERNILLPSGELKYTIATYSPDIYKGAVVGFFVHVEDVSNLSNRNLHTLNNNLLVSNSGKIDLPAKNVLEEVVETLKANLLIDFPGIKKLSKTHFISESKLKRDFKAAYQTSPFSYYRTMQMEWAEIYIAEKGVSKKQVAAILNFSNPANFSACFNKYLKEKKTLRLSHDIQIENDDLYKTFITQTPFAIAMYDTEMRCMAVSKKWISDNKLENFEFIGLTNYDIFPFQDPKWKTMFEECLKGEIKSDVEDEVINPDGSSQWSKWDIRPWRFKENQIGGLLVSTEDITDKKRQENEYKNTAKIFEKTNQISRIGTWERNFKLQTIELNDIAKDILEVPADFSPLEDIFKKFIREENSIVLLEHAMSEAKTNCNSFDIYLYLNSAKGNEKKVRLIGYPEVENGNCERIYGIVQELKAVTGPIKETHKTGF